MHKPIEVNFRHPRSSKVFTAMLSPECPAGYAIERLMSADTNRFLEPPTPGNIYALVNDRTGEKIGPNRTLGDAGIIDGDTLECTLDAGGAMAGAGGHEQCLPVGDNHLPGRGEWWATPAHMSLRFRHPRTGRTFPAIVSPSCPLEFAMHCLMAEETGPFLEPREPVTYEFLDPRSDRVLAPHLTMAEAGVADSDILAIAQIVPAIRVRSPFEKKGEVT